MHEGNGVVDRDVEKLTEALRLCRLELVSLQQRQEVLLEERNHARRRAAVNRRKLNSMSVALAKQLSSHNERGAAPWPALTRIGRARGATRGSEAKDLELIESSPLFRAPWYLRRNMDVVAAGVNPALHFLRVGAVEGRNPGPKFDTVAYVAEHPELRESGVNPLVHYLNERSRRRAS